MISRRSCSGGRPKSRARPRRSKRHADRTGSINSQRASDRSLGYARRSAMSWTYRRPGACAQACIWPGGSTEQIRASWNETGVTRLVPQTSHHRPQEARPPRQPHPHQFIDGRNSGAITALETKTTSEQVFLILRLGEESGHPVSAAKSLTGCSHLVNREARCRCVVQVPVMLSDARGTWSRRFVLCGVGRQRLWSVGDGAWYRSCPQRGALLPGWRRADADVSGGRGALPGRTR